jgi:predicted dehydrogenase
MTRRVLLSGAGASLIQAADSKPLRIGLIGLCHGHVKGLFQSLRARPNVQLVGVAESNKEVAERYRKAGNFQAEQLYDSAGRMLDATKPEAAVIYTDTFDHLQAVKDCAARKVHCMMEKPLAVSVGHGRAIQQAAGDASIHVLVNYETTWYPVNAVLWKVAREEKRLGTIRRLVIRDGHQGPKEIGVEPEFLAWLTDAKRNGGGALFDFGCYGANLATWLNDGQRPLSVTAVTQTLKPEIYRGVDDEANVILTYPSSVALIHGSWNWPTGRKDLDIFGTTGSATTVKDRTVRLHRNGQEPETIAAHALSAPHGDSLGYLAAVVAGAITPSGLSALDNNLIVTEILDAARRSAATGRTIHLSQ